MSVFIELKVGGIYFHVGFNDPSLSIPVINTVTYSGIDSEFGHLFELVADSENSSICFPNDEIYGILDKENLIKWLQEEHGPNIEAKTYEYTVI